jgi:hypothetical protein
MSVPTATTKETLTGRPMPTVSSIMTVKPKFVWCPAAHRTAVIGGEKGVVVEI